MAYEEKSFLSGVAVGRSLHGRHIGAKGEPVIVEGTINITANGTYDVTHYEKANVQVPLKEYTLDECFSGTTLYIPVAYKEAWFSARFVINSITDSSVNCSLVLRFVSGFVPSADDFAGCIMSISHFEIPCGSSPAAIRIPDMSGVYYGEYTSGGKDMTGCGIELQKFASGLMQVGADLGIVDGEIITASSSNDENYTAYLRGDGWNKENMDMNFTIEIPVVVSRG